MIGKKHIAGFFLFTILAVVAYTAYVNYTNLGDREPNPDPNPMMEVNSTTQVQNSRFNITLRNIGTRSINSSKLVLEQSEKINSVNCMGNGSYIVDPAEGIKCVFEIQDKVNRFEKIDLKFSGEVIGELSCRMNNEEKPSCSIPQH